LHQNVRIDMGRVDLLNTGEIAEGTMMSGETINAAIAGLYGQVASAAIGARELAGGTIGDDKLHPALAGQLGVPPGSIATRHLATAAAAADTIADGAADDRCLAENSVSHEKLYKDAVSGVALAAHAVTASSLAASAVQAAALAAQSIGQDALAALSVDTDALGAQAVGTVALADSAITAAKLGVLGLPTGAIAAFGGIVPPAGWAVCDGANPQRDDPQYSALFAVIGTGWGEGNGSTTFALPDLPALSLRGWDHGSGNDEDAGARAARQPGGATGDHVGSYQTDAYRAHRHATLVEPRNGETFDTWQPAFEAEGALDDGRRIGYVGGSETRGKNVYVLWIIKL
jgi:microcystin-dependent protein